MRLNPRIPGMATNPQFPPNLQIPGQEDWAFAERDPYSMGYVEHPSVCIPYYCYPYPPPPQFPSYGPVYMGLQPMFMPMMGVSYLVPDQYVQVPDMAMSRARHRSRIARVHENEEHFADHKPAVVRTRKQENEEHFADHKPADHKPAVVQTRKQENEEHRFADHKPAVVRTRKQENGDPSVASAGQARDSKDLMFLLAKQLSRSGVNSLGRIVLPKKEAEAYLPHLIAGEGVLLTMRDFDTRQNWTFRYRFWSNNKSRMYLLENTHDFVRAHNLQQRDMLVLYRDSDGSYVVRGEKYGTNPQTCDNSGDIAPADEVTTTEEEISRREQTLELLI